MAPDEASVVVNGTLLCGGNPRTDKARKEWLAYMMIYLSYEPCPATGPRVVALAWEGKAQPSRHSDGRNSVDRRRPCEQTDMHPELRVLPFCR